MSRDEQIITFKKVSFEFGINKPILDEVDFSVRRGMKVTLMGQNGAGKSTIFKLLTKVLRPESGSINVAQGLSIATAHQVIPREDMALTVLEFFERCFPKKVYDIERRIDRMLQVVNLQAPHNRIIKSFSGGQQARLLLAAALIQDPDLLLLDEPTNNLDIAGIAHLTNFLRNYAKTCIVISHDAQFLSAFTDGVLYLDVFTRKIEQYVGDYYDVVAEIATRVEKENRKNAQLARKIQDNKDKSNFFANKGGQMRLLAKRMREEAAALEEKKVDVRREDKTIRPFTIPAQPDLSGEIIRVTSFTTIKDHQPVEHTASISLNKNRHLLLAGPNGIGKSTLLESIAAGKAKGVTVAPGVNIMYYRQDFSTLHFEDNVRDALLSVMTDQVEQRMRSVAAGFLIDADMMHAKIGDLSEGQKGLVAFAQLALQQPGLLLLDEPTNHINFRHLPVIAAALDHYRGTMILVSHVPEFVSQIRIDETLDLAR